MSLSENKIGLEFKIMKALMSHYVRKFDLNFPHSKHKEIEDFAKEIKNLISLGYKFKNVTEAINSLKKNEDSNKVILLTFDDGLKDHLDAAKILKNLGIPKGTFYIPTQPYLNNEILHVHKAHLILSKEGEKSLDLLFEACNQLDISITDHNNYEIEKENYKNAYSRFDSNSKIKEFKRLINFYGSIGLRDTLLNEIIIKLGILKKAEDLYLSFDEIKEISEMGFEIGSHGVSHTLLSRLDKKKQKEELSSSKKFLEHLISKKINSFCYPYGGKKSYNQHTLRLLKEVNYHNAISVEQRNISEETIKNNLFEIPRYDCNQITELFLKR